MKVTLKIKVPGKKVHIIEMPESKEGWSLLRLKLLWLTEAELKNFWPDAFIEFIVEED